MNRLFFTFFLLLFSIAYLTAQPIPFRLGEKAQDFEKLGLNTSHIPEKWEDGDRTQGVKGSFEWWYFDAHLEDGTTVIIIFFTKPFIALNRGLMPIALMEINRPDGSFMRKIYRGKKKEWFAEKDSCNVQLGKQYFRGNLEEYEIHFEDEEIDLTANIQKTYESWRPRTGHILVGEKEDEYFAWVVGVPRGKVEIKYDYLGESYHGTGSGYHDHNWGTANLAKLMNHWYWSRAEIGPYNIIASEMITEKEYGKSSIPVFNISKHGKTIADDESKVQLYRSYGKLHPKLKKDLSDELLFVYEDTEKGQRYEYALDRKKNILEADLVRSVIRNKILSGILKGITGFKPAYFRMSGMAEIRVFQDDEFVESFSSPKAIWELMYFGKPYR